MNSEKVMVDYLAALVRDKTPVVVFTKNGHPLYGVVGAFDRRVIVLSGKLVYHSAISTIEPQEDARKARRAYLEAL